MYDNFHSYFVAIFGACNNLNNWLDRHANVILIAEMHFLSRMLKYEVTLMRDFVKSDA